MSDLQALLLAVGAVLTALVTIWRVVALPMHRQAKRLGHFLDDWFGEAARPGRAAIPPMPERIANLERQQQQLTEELETFSESSSQDRKKLHQRLDAVVEAIEVEASGED